jgi:RNAse (barnase) inhibitor barstar
MAWQVAIVADDKTDIAPLLCWHPVWAWSTPQRLDAAQELRAKHQELWSPDPALTLINTPAGDDPVLAVVAEIPTLELHHSQMTAVSVFGLKNSTGLNDGMAALGYKFVRFSDRYGLLFTRPMSSIEGSTELELDATAWRTAKDVYDSFFKAVGAPEWHGRNFDALNDSIVNGGINKIEVPYTIIVRNLSAASPEAAEFLKKFAGLISEFQMDGCPVEIRIDG